MIPVVIEQTSRDVYKRQALGLWLRYFDRFIGGQAARLRQKFRIK